MPLLQNKAVLAPPLAPKKLPFFKVGKDLKDRVDG